MNHTTHPVDPTLFFLTVAVTTLFLVLTLTGVSGVALLAATYGSAAGIAAGWALTRNRRGGARHPLA